MFNSCYFSYADCYSGKYDLIIAYVNRYESFVAGASYEPITDVLPTIPENILTGIDYSKNRLEFTVEIINPNSDIPLTQLIEINDWLCGQDGWKTLKLKSPDFSKYHLKCLFVPESIIRDVTGYRGIRCKLINISSFWYGDERVYSFEKSDMTANGNVTNFTFAVNNDSGVDLPVYPIIQCKLETSEYQEDFSFWVNNYTNSSLLDMVMSTDDNGVDTDSILTSQLVTINSKYPYFYTTNPNNAILKYKPHISSNYNSLQSGLLYLSKGKNTIQVACHTKPNNSHYRYYDKFIFKFSPRYRIGGF